MVDQYGRWYPDYMGQQPFQDPAYMRAIGQNVQGQQMPGTQMSSANQPIIWVQGEAGAKS